MRAIVVYNPKGGVGKSAVAVNLAATLVTGGVRALVIDLDPQASATRALGLQDDGRSLADALTALDALPVRATAFPGLDVVPSGPCVREAERILASEAGAEWVVRDKLGRAAGYELVVLDSPPGVGALSRAALIAADAALVPFVPAPTALEGLTDVVATLETRRLTIAGLLATMERRHTPRLDEVRDILRRRFGDWLLTGQIRYSEKIEEASARGRPLALLSHDSAVAADFREVACEVWVRLLKSTAVARTA